MKSFRAFCLEMWLAYQEEKFAWEQRIESDSRNYFSKYRWWLKNRYKQERTKNGIKNVREH